MKKVNIKKLLRRLPRNTEVVIKNKDGSYSKDWSIEIKYTSEGTWIVLFDLSEKK